ncbi:MAG: cytochrome c family protein [Polyangiaceae bacterium]|nr:cytochrome c family protein [Polyangiaceae bacterium]
MSRARAHGSPRGGNHPAAGALLALSMVVAALLGLHAPGARAAGEASAAASSGAGLGAPAEPTPASSGEASAASGNAPAASDTAPAASGAPAAAGPLVRGLAPMPGGAPVPERWRSPGAVEGDGGPSPVVFPPQRLTIRFNHRLHVRSLGVPCTGCHERARTSRSARDSLLPPATRCDACHLTDHRDLSEVTGEPEHHAAACVFCHVGYRPEDGNRVARMSVPPPRLRFSHAAHGARNIGCRQCHGEVQELELATRDQLPRMRGCLACHGQQGPARGDAPAACVTCHLAEASGRMKTSFAEGRLVPPAWLHGAGHGPDWIERHRAVAAADGTLCATCHQERECAECHDGRVRPRRVHPNDFLSSHPVAARQNDPRCTSCHRTQSFCLGCHQRAGVTLSGPDAAFAGRGRFHPPPREWTDPPRGAGHHAWEAQRNLDACVSCHTERDCAGCHASREVGGRGAGSGGAFGQGSNPHPVGFRSRCRVALRKNARPCLVCHDPRDARLEACR